MDELVQKHPAQDAGFAVVAQSGVHHLGSDDVQEFGNVSEFVRTGSAAVGEQKVLLGDLQFCISGCTPTMGRANKGQCQGKGSIPANPNSKLHSNGQPALQVGDVGVCTGMATLGTSPVSVVCRLRIAKSCQAGALSEQLPPVIAQAAPSSPPEKQSTSSGHPPRARLSIQIEGRPPGEPLKAVLRKLSFFDLKLNIDASGTVTTQDGLQVIPLIGFLIAGDETEPRKIQRWVELEVFPLPTSTNPMRKLQIPILLRHEDFKASEKCQMPVVEVRTAPKGEPKKSQLNLIDRVYVNCGSWTSGRTDFAAIKGNEILLGSWGNFREKGRKPASLDTDLVRQLFKPPGQTSVAGQFQSAGNRIGDRLFVMDHHVSLQQFLPPESGLWIFIGDCHIHGLRDWHCDNFSRPGQSHEISARADGGQSCGPELAEFLEYLEVNVRPARIVQIGDMYEVWELQGLIERAQKVMEDVYIGYPDLFTESEFNARRQSLIVRKRHLEETLSDPEYYEGGSLIQNPPSSRSWLKRDFEGRLADPQRFASIVKNYDNEFGIHPESAGNWKRTRHCLLAYFGLEHTSTDEFAATWLSNVTLTDAMALLEFANGGRFAGAPLAGRNYFDLAENAFWNSERGGWLDRDTVIRRIQRANPALSKLWTRLRGSGHNMEIISGNHDTAAKNEYLEKLFEIGPVAKRRRELCEISDREREYEQDPTANLNDPENSHSTCQRRMVYEHGDAFDLFNNDFDFFKRTSDVLPPRGGFDGTAQWAMDELNMDTTLLNAFGGLRSFTALGNEVISVGVDWRLPVYSERRACRIFEANPGTVRVVVLGHTHQPGVTNQLALDVRAPRAQVECRRGLCLSRAENAFIHKQAGADIGTVTVECVRGSVDVTLLTTFWDSKWEEEKVVDSFSLHAGHPPQSPKEYPEASRNSWLFSRCDQTNILRLQAITEECEVNFDMRSIDRPPVTL